MPPLPHATPAPSRNAALDGLRGLAALLVVLSHLDNYGMGLVPGLSFAGTGKYGVFLFFVLSAHLLTAQWLSAEPSGLVRADTWGRYLLRRILRIYPLFLVVVGAGWLFARSGVVIPLDSNEAAAHLLLQQGKDVLWSVPVEFKYYFVLPLVALFLRATPPALLAPAGATLLGGAAWLWPGSTYPINGIALGPYLPLFMGGALAATVCQRYPSQARRATGALAVLALVAVAALTPDLARLAGAVPQPARWHTAYLLFAVLWTPVVIACALDAGPAALFRWPPLRWLGRVSFSLYLWHMSALLAVRELALPAVPGGWTALALALLAAGCSERLIERPMNALWRDPARARPALATR